MGSSANYVAQVEGGLALSEKKLARYAEALGLTLPFLRYGVAQGADVEVIRREAGVAARLQVLAELGAWIAASLPVAEPAPGEPTLRRQGPSVIQEPPPDTFDQPIPRRKPGQQQA